MPPSNRQAGRRGARTRAEETQVSEIIPLTSETRTSIFWRMGLLLWSAV